MTDLERAESVYQDRLAIAAKYEALKQEARRQVESMRIALDGRDMEEVRRVLDLWRDAGLGFAAVKGLLLEIRPAWGNADVEELLDAVEVEL